MRSQSVDHIAAIVSYRQGSKRDKTMITMTLFIEAKQLSDETMNAAFRISPNENNWSLYIVKSCTLFKGELDEVIQLYIEEIKSYRKPALECKHIKIKKPYKY